MITHAVLFQLVVLLLPWQLAHCVGQYKCVFGFSTGHVGTGTLGDRASYNHVNHIEFLFEGYRQSKPTEMCRVHPSIYNQGFTAEDEENFVSNVLTPFLARLIHITQKSIIVDFGHANLFYYRGIARHFLSRSRRGGMYTFCKHLHFVRIRRERYESATSLMYRTPTRSKTSLCEDVPYAYCPYNNSESVLLHPVSKTAWHDLGVLEQMLWYIDEVEARWQEFKALYKDTAIRFTEVSWAANQDGFNILPDVVNITSSILQATPRRHLHRRNIHVNHSTTGGGRSVQDMERFAAAEVRYRAAMGMEVSRTSVDN